MKMKQLLLAGIAACLLCSAPAAAASESEETKRITVSAKESVFMAPDKASIVLEVISEGTDSSETQKENSEKTERVKQALTEAGVEEKDIRTSYFDISPKYDYSSTDMQITGYIATNQLELTGQDIDNIGKLIALGSQAGANGVSSLNFYCSNYDTLYLNALDAAVKTAETKASALASAAGYDTVEAISITEGYQNDSVRYASNNMMMDTVSADYEYDSAFSVPISSGESEISANVTVIYEMK